MMTHNHWTILHLLVFPVSILARVGLRKVNADEGHMLVLQGRYSVSETCTATCRMIYMTCDFEGIEDIPQQYFESMLKQLLTGFVCVGKSPLSANPKYKFHNSDNEPSFNYGNECASRYIDIGGKGVLPLCNTVIPNPDVGRICRCSLKELPSTTSKTTSPSTITAADSTKATSTAGSASSIAAETAKATSTSVTASTTASESTKATFTAGSESATASESRKATFAAGSESATSSESTKATSAAGSESTTASESRKATFADGSESATSSESTKATSAAGNESTTATESSTVSSTANNQSSLVTDSSKKCNNFAYYVVIVVLLILVLLLLVIVVALVVIMKRRKNRKPGNAVGTAKSANPVTDRATDAKDLASTRSDKPAGKSTTKSKTPAKSEKTIGSNKIQSAKGKSGGKVGGSKNPSIK